MNSDYSDRFSCPLRHTEKDIEAYARAFFLSAHPRVVVLFQWRNSIVSFFGLKGSKMPKNRTQFLENCLFDINNEIGLFRVMEKSMDEITLGQDDKHLNFRLRIGKEVTANRKLLYMKTEVEFHNFYGRIYFMFVRPFHRFIAPIMLQRIVKNTV